MTSIGINFNSRQLNLDEGTTLREFISTQIGKELDANSVAADGSKLGVAAAVNGAVVPRSAWNSYLLAEGHSIELVTAAQGG
ncbi:MULTISPECIES: sulfur carrier protein ThiS [Micrococcaceae]|uniref:sulfur carrier protein ThiS n=1 Tax=Micrococcaceae TaxID=1268 RepID=UPI000CFC8593|nr:MULTISPECIES: sulfur carrier protein ThiS [unclassified Arthrobacter]MCS3491313.1 sulfur carrier protein [Arthrobacter sp. JUb119]PQZ87430.1 thiamine biosynthesis protein ThiS [Arthrobacter sp. MYb222]PRB78687.1 thiamine biosynthesis protein ThiS [Arthrobacter sp. MYb214]TDU27916.1 sulfur carrier protein [Arthrobacter sp. JUb115]